MKTLAEEWVIFRATCVRPSADAREVCEFRRMFMCGAMSMFRLILDTTEYDTDDERADALEAWADEFVEFRESVKAGEA